MVKLAAWISIAVLACKSEPAAPPQATPPQTAPSPAAVGKAAAGRFTLGEATLTELVDKQLQPISRVAWKLHSDGTTERASKSGKWRTELQAKPDGTIWIQGQLLATVKDTAIEYAIADGPKPIAIDGNTVSVVVWQKQHDGEDFTAKVELANDGVITVHHRDNSRAQWKIEASDPAVMRTAFHIFALSMKAELD